MSEEQAIRNFLHQVQHLHEAEYGDFKRKLALYIHRTREALGPHVSSDVHRELIHLKHDILYVMSSDIEQTRRQVMDRTENLLARVSQTPETADTSKV